MFDLASLDTKTLSEKGVPMVVVHPKSRGPIMRDDGSKVTITKQVLLPSNNESDAP